jgi:hypothetical protein
MHVTDKYSAGLGPRFFIWTFFTLCDITKADKRFETKLAFAPRFTEGLWRGKEGGLE